MTPQVWDYVGDNYVHRLIQSKTAGMLVEVPSPSPSAERHSRSGGMRGESECRDASQEELSHHSSGEDDNMKVRGGGQVEGLEGGHQHMKVFM